MKGDCINLQNFQIQVTEKSELIVSQIDVVRKPAKLSCVDPLNRAAIPNLKTEWWMGNKFVDGKYVLISFANLGSRWVCHIKKDLPNQNNHPDTIGPYDVEILSESFFLVKGYVTGFWVFLQADRILLCYNPFHSKGNDGSLVQYQKGWMRFAYQG
eukprot:TRINITY_DN1436_c0_g1_i3.p1 TRINITY_DN1436_c0_g1~~TRINITY_DN1436_c0_g1_i3.p1  ORF type:complete len:156 (+),score=10.27 TRINITY_DN1436_c0_g1_i3:529-996(+)